MESCAVSGQLRTAYKAGLSRRSDDFDIDRSGRGDIHPAGEGRKIPTLTQYAGQRPSFADQVSQVVGPFLPEWAFLMVGDYSVDGEEHLPCLKSWSNLL